MLARAITKTGLDGGDDDCDGNNSNGNVSTKVEMKAKVEEMKEVVALLAKTEEEVFSSLFIDITILTPL